MTPTQLDEALATELLGWSSASGDRWPTREVDCRGEGYQVYEHVRWTALDAQGILDVKRLMNARGWWFSLRDAGNGTDIDAIFFWAKNWRRDGRARGRPGEEALVVAEAAWKALKSAEPVS